MMFDEEKENGETEVPEASSTDEVAVEADGADNLDHGEPIQRCLGKGADGEQHGHHRQVLGDENADGEAPGARL